jgi:hypothetical protein
MRDRWLDDLAARVAPDEQAQLRQFYSVFPVPDSLPTYDRLLVDDLEYLWVRERLEPGSPVHAWSVFSPTGRWLGEVELPRDVQPTHIGTDFMVAITTGADDVEQVVVFGLEGRGR